MKKYKLSVYSDSLDIAKLEPGIVRDNIYDDGWIGSKGIITLKTGETGTTKIKCYYPGEVNEGDNIEIIIDDIFFDLMELKKGDFEISLDLEPDALVKVELRPNYRFKPMGVDGRELSFIVSGVFVE